MKSGRLAQVLIEHSQPSRQELVFMGDATTRGNGVFWVWEGIETVMKALQGGLLILSRRFGEVFASRVVAELDDLANGIIPSFFP